MVSISRKKAVRKSRGGKKWAADALSAGATNEGLQKLIADGPPDLSSVDGVAKKNVDQMSAEENRLTGAWFTAYIDGLDDARIAVETAIPRAPASKQPNLIVQKDDLVAKSIDAMQQKIAFFESKTINLRPPTQQVIDETVRLSNAIADRITTEKRAEAIVKLVNDLAGVFTKLKS